QLLVALAEGVSRRQPLIGATGKDAKIPQVVGNILKGAGFGDVDRQPEAFEVVDNVDAVAAVPGDHQVRVHGHQAFAVDLGEGADAGNRQGVLGIVAVADGGDDMPASPHRKQRFGDIGGEADDAAGGFVEHQGVAEIVYQADFALFCSSGEGRGGEAEKHH